MVGKRTSKKVIKKTAKEIKPIEETKESVDAPIEEGLGWKIIKSDVDSATLYADTLEEETLETEAIETIIINEDKTESLEDETLAVETMLVDEETKNETSKGPETKVEVELEAEATIEEEPPKEEVIKPTQEALYPGVTSQDQMFFNLEEGRIHLDEEQKAKDAEKNKITAEREAQEKLDNASKPRLICPFCANIQYTLNSKDPTTAWCDKCGRAFMVDWK